MSTQVKSTLAYIRQPDGMYTPVFYINTSNDVYVDIENKVTLADVIANGTIRNRVTYVKSDSERFALTESEVKLHDFVNVESTGNLYEVIDTSKLSTEDGYKRLNLVGGANEAFKSMDVYLDPVNGNDVNDGLDASAPMKTIRAAIIKYSNVGYIKVYLADGEYTDEDILKFNSVYRMDLVGNNSDNTKVVIKFPIIAYNANLYMQDVTVDVSSFDVTKHGIENPFGINTVSSKFTAVRSRFIGSGLSVNSATVIDQNSEAYFNTCYFAEWNIGIRAANNSTVTSKGTTTNNNINITYSAVDSIISYSEDKSTPIQMPHASNIGGTIIANGLPDKLKQQLVRPNFLHNWDFSNALVLDNDDKVTGVGEFLSRWRSASAGNVITTTPFLGLTFSTTSEPGFISQSLSYSLTNLAYRTITFGVIVGLLPADAVMTLRIYAFDYNNVSTLVAEKTVVGTGSTSHILYECTGRIEFNYTRLDCRIYLDTPNVAVRITKAKLEVGDYSTLRSNDAMDKTEQALKCKDVDINGNYKNITGILYDKGYSELSADPIKSIYINPVTGNDNNDGRTETTQMRTIRAAVTKYGGSGLLRLILANGEYTDSGVLYINGVSSVTIQPASGVTNSVVIKFPIYFKYVPFYIEHITFDLSQNTSATFGITARSCQFALSSCKIIGNGINGNMFGVVATLGASGIVYLNDISACSVATRSESGSTLNVSNATSTSGNRIGYSAIGGIISYNGDTMVATSLFEKSTSGVIFANGSLTGGAGVTMADATLV